MAFVLLAILCLAILCLALLGFACECLGDHPMQAVDRALSAVPALPALIEVWSLFAIAALASGVLVVVSMTAARAPSPATLKRFLL